MEQKSVREIYLFVSGEGDLLAFSTDKTGANIPEPDRYEGWLLRRRMDLDELSDKRFAGVIELLGEQGQCVIENVPEWGLDE